MHKAVVAPNLLAVHIERRIKPFQLTGDTGLLIAGIEDSYRTTARLPLTQRLPGRRGIVANGRNHSDAGHYDAPGHMIATSQQVRSRSTQRQSWPVVRLSGHRACGTLWHTLLYQIASSVRGIATPHTLQPNSTLDAKFFAMIRQEVGIRF